MCFSGKQWHKDVRPFLRYAWAVWAGLVYWGGIRLLSRQQSRYAVARSLMVRVEERCLRIINSFLPFSTERISLPLEAIKTLGSCHTARALRVLLKRNMLWQFFLHVSVMFCAQLAMRVGTSFSRSKHCYVMRHSLWESRVREKIDNTCSRMEFVALESWTQPSFCKTFSVQKFSAINLNEV